MKRLISFMLICLLLLNGIVSTEVFADTKKDVQPFFTDVGSEGLAVKNDGTLWEFDAYEFTVEKYTDNVKKAYFSYLENDLDGKVYYLIKNDDSLWKVMDYYGNSRRDKWTKLMDNVQDFAWEKGVGGSNNFGYYALKNDGTVLCWGNGGTSIPGALNSLEEGGPVSIPLSNPVTLATDVRMLNAGYLVKNDDTLWTWGWGRRPFSDKNEDFEYPVKIMDDVKSVCGNYIIKTDNSLWAWGAVRYPGNGTDNYNGFLEEPVKIMDDVKKVSGNLALKTDGTVYLWGAIEVKTFPQCPEVSLDPIKIEEGIRDICWSSRSDIMMLKNNGELWFYGYHRADENGSRYAPYKLMNLCSFSLTGQGTIVIGEDAVITAEYYDEYGNLRYDNDVSWECTDYHLLSLAPNGNTMSVKGLSEGIAHIKATHNPTGEVAEFDVTVCRYKTSLSPAYSIVKGDTRELEYYVLKGSLPVDCSNMPVVWTIEQSVNANGDYGNVVSVKSDHGITGGARKIKLSAEHKGECYLKGTYNNIEIANIRISVVGDISEIVRDEMILRAKVLSENNRFDYYRKYFKSPSKIMTENVWLKPSEFYDGATQLFKSKDDRTDYYEILLTALLLDDISKGSDINNLLGYKIDTSLLASMNTILGADFEQLKDAVDGFALIKAKETFMAALKEFGTTLTKNTSDLIDSKGNLGFSDLVSGLMAFEEKSKVGLEAYSQMLSLGVVADSKIKAIEKLSGYSSDSDFKKSVEKVKEKYVISNEETAYAIINKAMEQSSGVGDAFIKETLFNVMIANTGFSALKFGFDVGLAVSNMAFSADKLSNRLLTMGAYSTLESLLCSALEDAKKAFDNNPTLDTASEFVALADMYKLCLIKSCEEAGDFVAEAKSSKTKLNRRVFGDYTPDEMFSLFEAPDYEAVTKTIDSTKRIIENSNFYESDIDVAAYISEVRSTEPSQWAKADIDEAIALDLLPDYMQHNYQESITRAEFCTLTAFLVEKLSGKDIEEVVEEKGVSVKSPFADTYYKYVDYIYKLGIVNGIGSDLFDPLGHITREQAATMLKRTASLYGDVDILLSDIDESVSPWAVDGVNYVLKTGIMRGTGEGFSPLGMYTKEQAITTFVRIYKYINA